MYVKDPVSLNPLTLPGTLARYDATYYLRIATEGYSHWGPDITFFPAFLDARYVLMLFPSWIVFGILVERYRRFRYGVWAGTVGWLIFLKGWWVTGHWVA